MKCAKNALCNCSNPDKLEIENVKKIIVNGGLLSAIRIEPDGTNRYHIFTPFMFDNGDHYVIILKLINNRWVLTDEGNTLMSHRSPDINEDDLLIQEGQIVIDILSNGCNSLLLMIHAIKKIGGQQIFGI